MLLWESNRLRRKASTHEERSSAVHGTETLGLLAQLLEGLHVFPERMKSNLALTHGLISAEAVMMSLAGFIGRQEAHDVVHHAATEAAVSGTDFLEVLRKEPRITRVLTEDQLEELLDPSRHTGLSEQLAHETVARAEHALAGR